MCKNVSCLLVISIFLCLAALAQENEGKFSKGSGTVSDPYILYTIEEVQAVGENDTSLSCHYRLGRNINATNTENWNDGAGFVPIGPFFGSFDGDGYHIDNLYIKTSNTERIGLFGFIV